MHSSIDHDVLTCQTIVRRLVDLIVYSDLTPIRAMLGLTALFWCLTLLLPGDTFDRDIYAHMRVVASEEAWAVAWGAYAALILWRTFAQRNSAKWFVLAINTLGMALFGAAAMCVLSIRLHPFPSAIVGNLVLSFGAFWVLMRSGVNNGPGWRGE